MQEDTFVVALGNQHITVSKRVSDVSQYFHNILSLGIDQDEIEVDPNIIDKETFDIFLKFCQLNDYSQPIVGRKITTNNLQQVLDSKNYDFIKEFPIQSPQLIKLMAAANFLVCRGLKLVVAAVYACKIYFQDSKQAYLAKKQQLGISKQEDIKFEQQQKYREEFMIEESLLE